LTSLEATYPHPQGLIHVKYQTGAEGTKADVELPAGLSGVFVWKGKETRLHSGSNTLTYR